jgi:NTE family protein
VGADAAEARPAPLRVPRGLVRRSRGLLLLSFPARHEVAQTLAVVAARRAALEVRPHPGHDLLGVRSGELELHVAVQLLEAALARQLGAFAIPLHVIATDLGDGREVRLSSGPLVESVLASAAIPGVLPSVELNGRDLVDGGVANNTPISHAVELGAKRIYVLPTGQSCELESPPHGAVDMVLHAINLLMHRRLLDDIVRFRDSAELVVLPPPCPLDVQPMDFGKAERLIERSLDQSRRFLDERGKARPGALPLSA